MPRDGFMALDRNGWALWIGMTGAFMSFGSEGTGLHKPLIIVGFSARAAAHAPAATIDAGATRAAAARGGG